MKTNAIKYIGWRALIALGVLAAPHSAVAEAQMGWRADTDLYLNSGLYVQHQGSDSSVHESASVMLFTDFWSPLSPVSAGLFVDYQLWSDGRRGGSTMAGGMLKYRLDRWRFSGMAAVSVGPDSRPAWFYMTNVGFKVNPDNKIGLSLMGPLARPENARLMLTWGRSVSDALSLSVGAGTALNRATDLTARIELTWHVR